MDGNRCAKVATDELVVYEASVTLDECKATGDTIISVGVNGHRDVVAVYITPLCSCDCEQLSQQQTQSAKCHAHGTLTCGACVCDHGFEGATCGCSHGESNEVDDSCRLTADADVCSGRGACNCGVCKCTDALVNGKYCECDQTTCTPADGGHTCNGHGSCECGVCRCDRDWNGTHCDCSRQTVMCQSRDVSRLRCSTECEQGQLCSNNGHCRCNKCECDAGHTGVHCEVEDEHRAGGDKKKSSEEEGSGEEPAAGSDEHTEGHDGADRDSDEHKPAAGVTKAAAPFASTLCSLVSSVVVMLVALF